MNILIVSCVFLPEPVVSGKSSFSLANYLTQDGNKVTVLAPYPSRPNVADYKQCKKKMYYHDNIFEEFRVIRCFSIFSKKSKLLSRFIENISFGITSSLYLLISKEIDVIYSNTWPLFASFLITIVAKLKRIPIVTSVQDLYPETLINQNRLNKKSFFIKGFLSKIDKFCLKSAARCIAISKGFRSALLKKGVDDKKIKIVYNWNTSEDFVNQNANINFRLNYGIENEAFLIIYAGNVSSSAGVSEVIKIFNKIEKTEKDAYLLIAGEGAQHKSCIELTKELKSKNIFFHFPWKSYETDSLLASANMLILPTLDDQALFSVPSKLISYMFSKKPIFAIANKKSDLYKIIEESESGWACELPNAEDLLLAAIKSSNQMLSQMGSNAFNYGNKYFNANLNLEKLANTIYDAKKNI